MHPVQAHLQEKYSALDFSVNSKNDFAIFDENALDDATPD